MGKKTRLQWYNHELTQLQELLTSYETNDCNMIAKAQPAREELIKNASNSEKIIKIKLKEAGINYEFKHVIPGKNSYMFIDFYLPDYKLILEIDEFKENGKGVDMHKEETLLSIGYNKILRVTVAQATSFSADKLKRTIKSVLGKKIDEDKTTRLVRCKKRIDKLEKELYELMKELSK